MAIRAFQLFGEIELKGDKVVVSNLKKVSHQVDVTKKDLGSLKSGFNMGGSLSGLNSALGTLSNISNVIQGIPVVGKLIDGAMSFATGPVKDMAQLGLGFNDLKENATLAFSVILKDGEKAKKLFADLAKFGKDSPIFKTGDLIGFSQQLLPILGAGPELFQALKGIGAATAATGRMDRMSDIFLAFTQIARKPKLSSEEMSQQLAEAGVDSWGLLARGLGRTPGEVMEMSAQGRLSGIGSFKVMIQQALMEYGALVDLMGQTRTGKQAQIDDTLEQLAARGTQNLHGTWKGGQDRILQQLQGPKGGQLADQINNVTGVIGSSVLGGFDALMDGSLLTKAQAAAANVVSTVQSTIQGAGDSARQTMQGYADQLYQGFTSFWEIQSPSKRAERLGQWIREGLEMGLSQKQAGNYAKLKSLSESQPDFVKKLVAGSVARGINPDHLLNVLAFESGFDAQADNPNSSAYGLIQFMKKTRQGLGVTQKQLSEMSETEQLEWVFRYYDQPHLKGKLNTQASLYAAVAAGRVGSNDQSILFRKGSEGYDANKVWDANRDGLIRQGELGRVALGALGAGDKFSVGGVNVSPSVTGGGSIQDEQMRKALALGKDALEQAYAFMQANDAVNQARAAFKGHDAVEQAQAAIKGADAAKQSERSLKELSTTSDQTVPGLEKLGTTAQLTAEQIEANRKLAEMDGPAKKKKRDPLFDSAFTREGIAGDFHGGLSSLLGSLGWGGSASSLGKQALFSFIRDAQGRMAHDFSSMITGAIFGGRGEDGKLTGGLFGGKGFSLGGIFSKLFGGLFGGFRAGGGSMSPGRFYVAGENGPELISGPGYVHNNRETRSMMGSGDPSYTIVAIGDREIGRAVEAYRSTPRGRRARLIEGKYGRKIMAYA